MKPIVVSLELFSIWFDGNNSFSGVGGMPVSSSGHGLILLSGGIDSPVAFYMMNKRGVKLHAIHMVKLELPYL